MITFQIAFTIVPSTVPIPPQGSSPQMILFGPPSNSGAISPYGAGVHMLFGPPQNSGSMDSKGAAPRKKKKRKKN